MSTAAMASAMELGPELLPNAALELENDSDARPDPWVIGTAGQGQIRCKRAQAVHFHTSSRSDVAWLTCRPNARVDPDVYYCVRARAKLKDAADDAGRVLVEFEDAGAQHQRYRYPLRLSGSCDYTEFRAVIKSPLEAARISLVRVGLYRAVGEAWFDWVSIRRAAVAEDRLMPGKDAWRIAPRPTQVTQVVDVCKQLSPDDYWRKFPAPARVEPIGVDKLFEVPLLRYYFFGLDFQCPGRTLWREKRMQHTVGALGKRVPDPNVYSVVIAEDIPHRPIMRNYRLLCDNYYPRRVHQWAECYLTSYLMTGSAWFLGRGLDMVNFMHYSQYGLDGENGWIRDFYPAYYATIQRNGLAKQWAGGYDYLFDFVWPDGYGYTWPLHAPDHHVNSDLAMWQVRAFEITGHARYLDSARRFLIHQMPRYGFHAGTWEGQRYYWSEYNPSGPDNPTCDATDNIQALLAQTAAAIGYYDRDPHLLECARGLLWYMCREWWRDRRWYYHGMENPMARSISISHDPTCVSCTMRALPYLLAAGVDVKPMLPYFEQAMRFYFTEAGAATEYFRGCLLFGAADQLAPGRELELVAFVQVTGLGAADPKLRMDLPKGFTIQKDSQLVARGLDGKELSRSPISVTALRQGVSLSLPLRLADMYRLSFSVRCPEGFRVEQWEHDPNKLPPTNPTFSAPVLAFVDEFGEPSEVTLTAQSYDTLSTITPSNFADFRARTDFPRPKRRR